MSEHKALEKHFEDLHNNPPAPFNPSYNPDWAKDRPVQLPEESDKDFDLRFYTFMLKNNQCSPEGKQKALNRFKEVFGLEYLLNYDSYYERNLCAFYL